MKKKPNIELAVKDLRPALTGLAKVISHNTLPVLGCVRIEPDPADGESILLTGTDLDTWLTLRIPGTADKAGGEVAPLLVPLADLRECVKGGGTGDRLGIQREKDNRISINRHIGTGVVARPATCADPDDWPQEPGIKAPSCDLGQHAQEALRQALHCCSGDPTRQVLNGVLLEEGKTFVGTDGRHLYRCNGMALPVKGSVVLAHRKVMDWPQLRGSTGWKLAVDKDWFQLSGGDWQLRSRLVEGNYPNWQQVMPQEGDYRSSVELAAGDLEQVCSTIAALPGEKQNSKPVGLRLTRDGCALLARNSDDGGTFTEVPVSGCKTKGPGVTVFLNRDYLAKALGFGLDRIDIIDEASPVRFRSSGADGREMIVMPVRGCGASPAPAPAPEHQPEPETERKPEPMKNNSNGGDGHQPQTDPEPSPLDEAVARINGVKDQLRQAASGLTEIAASLKQVKSEQKSTEREIRQVRSTIRSLQKVEL